MSIDENKEYHEEREANIISKEANGKGCRKNFEALGWDRESAASRDAYPTRRPHVTKYRSDTDRLDVWQFSVAQMLVRSNAPQLGSDGGLFAPYQGKVYDAVVPAEEKGVRGCVAKSCLLLCTTTSTSDNIERYKSTRQVSPGQTIGAVIAGRSTRSSLSTMLWLNPSLSKIMTYQPLDASLLVGEEENTLQRSNLDCWR